MRFLVAIPLLFACVAPAVAQQATGEDIARIVFSKLEKRVIKEYFGEKPAKTEDAGLKSKDRQVGKDKGGRGKGKNKDMPKGLAKRDSLPPGLAKQLERNGTLPPGLAKRGLPNELERRLPLPPKGRERVVVDDDVVLIEKATGRILDILADAARGQ